MNEDKKFHHTVNSDLGAFKPVLPLLIRFYYDDLGFSTGGSLHIVLDDGNIEHESILFCINYAEKQGDTLAALIGAVLLLFPEDQIEFMFENRWSLESLATVCDPEKWQAINGFNAFTCECGQQFTEDDIDYSNCCNEEGEDWSRATAYCDNCKKEHEATQWGELENAKEALELLKDHYE